MGKFGFLSAWQWHAPGSAWHRADVGYCAVAVSPFLRLDLVAHAADQGTRLQEAAPQTSGEITSPSAPSEPSPFAHRPGAVRAVSDADDPELAEYNRMLAALAARDGEEQD